MTHDPLRDPDSACAESGAVTPAGADNTRSAPDAATTPDSDDGRQVSDGPAPDSPAAEPAGEEAQLDAVVGCEGESEGEVDVHALTAKAQKADEYLSLAQRTQADFENYRKRAAREAAVARERGASKLALELLPAVDNLERAIAHAPEVDGEQEAFVAGIKHVHTDVIAALQRAGIERFSPEGEPFDPTLHEAVAQQPMEGFTPGTVVDVLQRGYRMGDSVVRPARVVVAG